MTGLVCRDHRGEANAKEKPMDRAQMRARGAIIVDGLVLKYATAQKDRQVTQTVACSK